LEAEISKNDIPRMMIIFSGFFCVAEHHYFHIFHFRKNGLRCHILPSETEGSKTVQAEGVERAQKI
jgi:hypothetical protein